MEAGSKEVQIYSGHHVSGPSEVTGSHSMVGTSRDPRPNTNPGSVRQPFHVRCLLYSHFQPYCPNKIK